MQALPFNNSFELILIITIFKKNKAKGSIQFF